MNVEIITNILQLDIFGFSGIASNGDYAGTAFKLMDKMWNVVKSNGLANKGRNIWVYEKDNSVFAGVELEGNPMAGTTLEHKNMSIPKYAYYKHVGPYNLIKQVGQAMNIEINNMGFQVDLPHIEIYGHWTTDESKLETELLMTLK